MSNEDIQSQRDALEIELQRLQNQQALKQSLTDQTKNYKTYLDYQKKSKVIELDLKLAKNKILEYQKEINKLEKDSSEESKKALASYKEKLNNEKKLIDFREKELKQLNSSKALGLSILNSTKQLVKEAGSLGLSLSDVWHYLMESDKAILSTTKNMGLSGQNAERFRDAINQSAQFAARMGVSVGELAEAQADFADSTGKVSSLTGEALRNIVAIGKGTALGVAGASEMASNFDSIGKSAHETRDFVQEVVNKSEKMGINTGKVLKNINSNFKQAQKFNFKDGVNGLAQMAMHAEKFRIDMQGTFNSAAISKTLEGAIQTSAKLNVLGGRFANFDPLRMLNLSRNNVEQYQKEMNDMLKGISNFDKKTGKFAITPEDLQRLDLVAEATGQSVDNLIQQANKRAQIEKMQSSLVGKTKEQKDLLEQMAVYNSKNGKFEIDINGQAQDIRTLGDAQLKSLQVGQASLEQRAQNAQTFDEQFKNTIMELKSSLLPLLKYVNDALKWFNSLIGQSEDAGGSYFKNISMAIAKFAGVGAIMLLVTGKLGAITKGLGGIVGGLAKGGGGLLKGLIGGGAKGVSGVGGGISDAVGGGAGKLSGALSSMPSPATLLAKAAGIAAIGVAAAGIGAGIFLAATGVKVLSDSLKGLSDKQLLVLGGAFLFLIGGIIGLGFAGVSAGPGLLIASIAILGISAAVLIASFGISLMANSLAKLTDPKIGDNLAKIGLGIGAIAGSSLLMANPLSLLSIAALAGLFASLPSGGGFDSMKSAFDSANTFLNAPVDNLVTLKNLIDSIGSSQSNPIAELSNLIGDGLTVKFDKDVQMNVTTEINLDGNQIAKATAVKTVKIIQSKQRGKG